MDYRLKLLNGRILGPLGVKEIEELYELGKITGNEKCQSFPDGEWTTLEEHSEIYDKLMNVVISKDLDEVNANERTSILSKIDFEESMKADETQELAAPEAEIPEVIEEVQEYDYKKETEGSEVESEEENKEEPEEIVESPEVVEEDDPGKTKVFDANALLNYQDLVAFRKVGKEEPKAEPNVQLKEDKKKALEGKSVKKIGPIAAIAILLIFHSLLFDKEEVKKKIVPIKPSIKYPIPFEKEDRVKAIKLFKKGNKKLNSGRYIDVLMASRLYKNSLEQKFSKNKSIGKLIYAYSLLLPHVRKEKGQYEKAATNIFRLIQIAKNKELTDIDVSLGMANFYRLMGKYSAAELSIRRFLGKNKKALKLFSLLDELYPSRKGDSERVPVQTGPHKNNLTLRLMALLAKIYYEKEDYKKFEIVINELRKNSKYFNIDSFEVMGKYFVFYEQEKNAKIIYTEGIKKFPNSVLILIEYGNFLVKTGDVEKLTKVIDEIERLDAERSPLYLSSYKKLKAKRAILEGDNKLAMSIFKGALKNYDDDDSRILLASLEDGGSSQAKELIKSSQIKLELKRVRTLIKEENWPVATREALRLADKFPKDMESRILLAKLQVKRGEVNQALSTFKNIHKDFPLNEKVNVLLLDTYLDNYKFGDAFEHIQKVSQYMGQKGSYAAALGKLYYLKGNHLQAISWWRKAINKDPVNDSYYYALAKLFLEKRKYKRSKILINKAMTLDPENLKYRKLYATILYELEGAESAIGYILYFEENKNSPMLMSEVAIYYFKNGQMAQYENSKKEIEEKFGDSTYLYKFLIETAKLEEKTRDVIKYTKLLLIKDPGNLKMRMTLGEYLLGVGQLDPALEQFEAVQERLSSYPRLLYFISRIYLLKNDIEKAKKYADMEIKNNKRGEYGHLLMGEIALKEDNIAEASMYFKNAQKLNPKSVEALVGVAGIKLKKNDFEMALDLFSKAAKLDTHNAQVRRDIGHCYRKLGQGALAVESYKVYLDMSPDAKDAGQVRSLIKALE